jgi:hypothetical protein
MWLDSSGTIHEGDPPGDILSTPVDVNLSMISGGSTPMPGGVMGDSIDEMGAPVPGLQADAPYIPADQVLIPGAGETPNTADVPYNPSDTAQSTGFGSSSAGAPKDTGGVGEWLTNGFKSLANGFLGTMTQQSRNATATQPGGSYGAAGPGWLGRFGTATAPLPSNTNSTVAVNQQQMIFLALLGVALLLVLGMKVGGR